MRLLIPPEAGKRQDPRAPVRTDRRAIALADERCTPAYRAGTVDVQTDGSPSTIKRGHAAGIATYTSAS